MSLKGTHSSDEDDHVVPDVGECWSLRCWQHMECQASCQPPSAPAERSLQTSGETREKSWHSSWTSHGIDLGLQPLVSKLLVQHQYLNMIPHLIDLFSKDPREASGHQWFISAQDSTADFPANCKPKGLPYYLIHHIAMGCHWIHSDPCCCSIRRMLWGGIWAWFHSNRSTGFFLMYGEGKHEMPAAPRHGLERRN